MRTAPIVSLALLACTPDYELVEGPPDVQPGDVTECGFTPIEGTPFSEYDCNPVFAGTGEEWGEDVDSVGFHAVPVLGHAFYQLWYSAHPDGTEIGDYGLGYAISGDGVQWESHPENPLLDAEEDAWDQDAMDAIQIVWDADNAQYLMAWQGYNLDTNEWGLGVATANDGVEWVKNPLNPVLDFSGTSEGVHYCWPLALTPYGGGSGFVGYLSGQPSTSENVCQIYPVYAPNLTEWNPSDEPILEAGPDDYDAAGMAAAAVAELDGKQYMFYIGFEDWEIQTGYQTSLRHSVNLATSEDGGATWEKDPANPFPINRSEDQLVSAIAAQVVGPRIHVWITDWYEDEGTQAVGYFLYEPEQE